MASFEWPHASSADNLIWAKRRIQILQNEVDRLKEAEKVRAATYAEMIAKINDVMKGLE